MILFQLTHMSTVLCYIILQVKLLHYCIARLLPEEEEGSQWQGERAVDDQRRADDLRGRDNDTNKLLNSNTLIRMIIMILIVTVMLTSVVLLIVVTYITSQRRADDL